MTHSQIIYTKSQNFSNISVTFLLLLFTPISHRRKGSIWEWSIYRLSEGTSSMYIYLSWEKLIDCEMFSAVFKRCCWLTLSYLETETKKQIPKLNCCKRCSWDWAKLTKMASYDSLAKSTCKKIGKSTYYSKRNTLNNLKLNKMTVLWKFSMRWVECKISPCPKILKLTCRFFRGKRNEKNI